MSLEQTSGFEEHDVKTLMKTKQFFSTIYIRTSWIVFAKRNSET